MIVSLGNRRPRNWKKNCIFRIVERDFTKKGRHKQISYITKSENVNECHPILKRHVKKGAFIMLDGCGIGTSAVLNKRYRIDQCNHKDQMYVKPNTYLEDAHYKVHNNTSENTFKDLRKKIMLRYGLKNWKNDGSNNAALWEYVIEDDWLNNYTNKKPNDCVLTFLDHLYIYYTF